jgi:glycosyltransferase involved in cell wall biosynthesis
VAAGVGYLASRWPRRRFLNDADGTLSLEYVDAGVWRRGSLGHRITGWAEARFLQVADASAVLTRVHAQDVRGAGHEEPSVLPCCVDTEHFAPRTEERAALREELGLPGRVFVYAGKRGGWYLVEAMFDFVVAFRRACSPASVLVLTTGPHEPFAAMARARGLPCAVRTADRAEMPRYLSAADVGLSFILSAPSKRACSPVKNGEYLACGLPLVTTAGIGDYSDLVANERVGVVVRRFESSVYEATARELEQLLGEADLLARCRRAALQHLDLRTVLFPRYRELYERLLGPPTEAR